MGRWVIAVMAVVLAACADVEPVGEWCEYQYLCEEAMECEPTTCEVDHCFEQGAMQIT